MHCHGAGYGWVIGWAFECAWQLFFLLESPAGMWVCLAMILGAFAAFAQTLLRLYRCADRCPANFGGHVGISASTS